MRRAFRSETRGSVPLRVVASVGQLHPQRTPLRSAPPVRLPFSEEVVEGTHDFTTEGTGVEPYTPWPPDGRPGWIP